MNKEKLFINNETCACFVKLKKFGDRHTGCHDNNDWTQLGRQL